MPYRILRFAEDIGGTGEWKETTFCGGLAWFHTKKSPPHIYEKKAEADKVVKKSEKTWPGVKFKLIEGEFEALPVESEIKKHTPSEQMDIESKEDPFWKRDDGVPF